MHFEHSCETNKHVSIRRTLKIAVTAKEGDLQTRFQIAIYPDVVPDTVDFKKQQRGELETAFEFADIQTSPMTV